MLKKLVTLLLITFIMPLCHAQETNIDSMMSPPLRQFLVAHPGASESLSNVMSEAFAGRSVQLLYFYSDDTNVARAYHTYPDDTSVQIAVQENQPSCDQCICLIFEMLNSEREKQYEAFEQEAYTGAISRTNFAISILREEFKADQKMRALLPRFKLSAAEIAQSHYYKLFMGCPDTFDAFLPYTQKSWPRGNDRITYYEQQYDYMRQALQQTNAPPDPTMK